MKKSILAHKLFLDINILLDVAELRQPHHRFSQQILSDIDAKKSEGFLSALSCPILYYVLAKKIGHRDSIIFIKKILKMLYIVEVNMTILERAANAPSADFEDAIQSCCAESCKADFIITRDVSGYKRSSISALSPEEYLGS